MKNNCFLSIYRKLYEHYGPQHWWPGETPFEVCIGAILTQNTAWTNVEKAIINLKRAGVLSAAGLRTVGEAALAQLIRPSGYYNVKTKKLKSFVIWLGKRCADNMDELFLLETVALRKELLGIFGIGEETADSILLYAGDKPVFVIDAYTKRMFSRLGLVAEKVAYGEMQRTFTEQLPSDTALFNEYHALIVRHGKEVCRIKPQCGRCCLATPGVTPANRMFPCRQ